MRKQAIGKATKNSGRFDLWLWAVRFYKTRSLAAEACRNGKVSVNGQRVKPSRNIHIGDVFIIRHQDVEKTIRVSGLLKSRVGAKVVEQFYEDITSPEIYAKAEQQRLLNATADLIRDRGAGRPTKRQRRQIEDVFMEAEQRETVYQQWDQSFKKNAKRSKKK